MKTTSGNDSRDGTNALHFITHPSFEGPDAERAYGDAPAESGEARGFMPDEATRAWTKRMHYAAWRASASVNRREATRWRRRYYHCRNRIVLGNHKLTFRAVQKWRPAPRHAEDLAGDCQVVLIKAVEAFNPWLGIRFSTYAFTCLMRALSRLSRRHVADLLSRGLPLQALAGVGAGRAAVEETIPAGAAGLEEYLGANHSLLTPREKAVLLQRFPFGADAPRRRTLEQIGCELGLSKERVRQVQSQALAKLRTALLAQAPAC